MTLRGLRIVPASAVLHRPIKTPEFLPFLHLNMGLRSFVYLKMEILRPSKLFEAALQGMNKFSVLVGNMAYIGRQERARLTPSTVDCDWRTRHRKNTAMHSKSYSWLARPPHVGHIPD